MSSEENIAENVAFNLLYVKTQIEKLKEELGITFEPRLVAVSKTKGSELILACYQKGQRSFGENYVQELVEKAALLPKDIKWHFIGHLQSNKIPQLLQVENLEFIETVDRFSLAEKLDKALQAKGRKLKVFIQVNTSREQNKSGCSPAETLELVLKIQQNCKNLGICGLMCIGNPSSEDPSLDFKILSDLKRQTATKLGIEEEKIELSMGMSGDYQQAIAEGSTSVRVGSTIFGSRIYKK